MTPRTINVIVRRSLNGPNPLAHECRAFHRAASILAQQQQNQQQNQQQQQQQQEGSKVDVNKSSTAMDRAQEKKDRELSATQGRSESPLATTGFGISPFFSDIDRSMREFEQAFNPFFGSRGIASPFFDTMRSALADPFQALRPTSATSGTLPSTTGFGGALRVPVPIDVKETTDRFDISADLPGVPKDAIRLNFDQKTNMLTIKGEFKSEKETKEPKDAKDEGEVTFHSWERRSGSFNRSIRLPSRVNADNISADYKDGVLNVKIPKAEPDTSSKEIKID